jgi:hypothetical protein
MVPPSTSSNAGPASIARYVKKNAPKVKEVQQSGHHGHGGQTTVREEHYKDHHIVIRTTYEVTVDGIPVTGHLGVSNDGKVHYHPVPNASYSSALDLVKALVDIFPEDFQSGGHGGEHGGHHGHGAHAAATAGPVRKAPKKQAKTAKKAAVSKKRKKTR